MLPVLALIAAGATGGAVAGYGLMTAAGFTAGGVLAGERVFLKFTATFLSGG